MNKKGRLETLTPKFVELIPNNSEELMPGTLYISAKHKTVVHRCPCGCGEISEFVLGPTRFRMIYDGESVTFNPSIGNSHLGCRSHYWIRGNQIEWCSPMQDGEIWRAREREHQKTMEARRQQDLRKYKGHRGILGKFIKYKGLRGILGKFIKIWSF